MDTFNLNLSFARCKLWHLDWYLVKPLHLLTVETGVLVLPTEVLLNVERGVFSTEVVAEQVPITKEAANGVHIPSLRCGSTSSCSTSCRGAEGYGGGEALVVLSTHEAAGIVTMLFFLFWWVCFFSECITFQLFSFIGTASFLRKAFIFSPWASMLLRIDGLLQSVPNKTTCISRQDLRNRACVNGQTGPILPSHLDQTGTDTFVYQA